MMSPGVQTLLSLPPIWLDCQPPLAQRLLAMYLVKAFPSEVVVVQYMDDILILGPEEWKVPAQTQALVMHGSAGQTKGYTT